MKKFRKNWIVPSYDPLPPLSSVYQRCTVNTETICGSVLQNPQFYHMKTHSPSCIFSYSKGERLIPYELIRYEINFPHLYLNQCGSFNLHCFQMVEMGLVWVFAAWTRPRLEPIFTINLVNSDGK